ncbi:phosphoglycerol transferase I [Xanthomonas sp. WHRI 7064]|uniref:phosphoglycerol transferase I n=1 Tax=Xanthomonas TaxID=338 RepID=UPI0004D6E214|nr:phosphoglycerol transferase I [Xanthomonas arboricola]KER88723.1 phosphoglycerol transferase I [Xanthomonas arboricola pv. celebensis]
MHWMLLFSLLLLLWLLVASPRLAWLKAGLLSLLLLLLSAWGLVDRLSGDGINAATLYHLRADMDGAGVSDFSGYIAVFIGMVLLSLSPLVLLRVRRFRRPRGGNAVFGGFVVMLLVSIAVSPLYRDGKRLYYQLRPVDYATVVPEYLVPQQPLQKRKNIVWIYGESLERTYFDEDVFPGLMPNLRALASEAVDVRNLTSTEGSGWTIAGMVASMCGVPLTTAPGDENSMGRMGLFLPEARCLGDYLKDQGYRNHYVGGADASFAGKGSFLSSHGFDVVHDVSYFRDKGVAPKHFSAWGVHDDVLLDDAWDSFQTLSRAGQPFMLTTLTMDTHHPAGHLPLACKGQHYDSALGDIGLLHAIKCSDRLIGELVARIRNSRYGKNTIIVIASDHLAMPNDLSDVLAKQKRENLLLFLGKDIAPQQVVTRAGSTLDSGATLLQLLEPGMRTLGFGRSLLASDAPPSASVAASRDSGKDYPRYLAYARTLWTGRSTRMLRINGNGDVVVGVQQVRPPVLLEYDDDTNLKTVYLENTSRQFDRTRTEGTLAYVDRCTAFEDGSADGDWCALVVDRHQSMKLYRDPDLTRGIAVDAPLEASQQGPRPRVRQPIMLTQAARKTEAGRYMLELYAKRRPTRAFWVEAVSSERKVVLAQQWVVPDAAGRIRMPVGLEHAVDDLEIRAWLDYTEDVSVDDLALVKQTQVADRS